MRIHVFLLKESTSVAGRTFHLLRDLKSALEGHDGQRLHKVLLFGLQARGDAREDSDVDVLVVLKDDHLHLFEEQLVLSDINWKLTKKYGALLNTVVTDSQSYYAAREPLFQQIAKEGRPI